MDPERRIVSVPQRPSVDLASKSQTTGTVIDHQESEMTFASEDAVRKYRATFKSRWNEAEPSHSIIFFASNRGAAAQKSLLLADQSEVVVDTVPLT